MRAVPPPVKGRTPKCGDLAWWQPLTQQIRTYCGITSKPAAGWILVRLLESPNPDEILHLIGQAIVRILNDVGRDTMENLDFRRPASMCSRLRSNQ